MAISVREAKLSDISEIARIGSIAFNQEPIYEHFFPYRSLYPEDYYQHFVNDAKKILNTPGQILVVAEKQVDQGSSEIRDDASTKKSTLQTVGYASFIKSGTTKQLASWNPDSWSKRTWMRSTLVMLLNACLTGLTRFLLSLWSLVSYMFPNRAISQVTIDEYYRQAAQIHAKHLDTSSSKIDFRTLAVDIDHQRQGVGQKLIEYIGFRAYTEEVLVFGDASSKGLPLYLRNGCKEIGRIYLPEQIVSTSTGSGEEVKIEPLEVVVLKWSAVDYFSGLKTRSSAVKSS